MVLKPSVGTSLGRSKLMKIWSRLLLRAPNRVHCLLLLQLSGGGWCIKVMKRLWLGCRMMRSRGRRGLNLRRLWTRQRSASRVQTLGMRETRLLQWSIIGRRYRRWRRRHRHWLLQCVFSTRGLWLHCSSWLL